MRNEGLAKTLIAGAAIAAHRIVTFDSDPDTVVQASAATDSLIGVSDLGADAASERVDVIVDGIALVEYGDTVNAGDLLTTDSDGKAVAAEPASGATARVIGVAMVGGVSGDIGSVRIAPSALTNASA